MKAKLAIVSGLLLAVGLLTTAGSANAGGFGFNKCGGGCFRHHRSCCVRHVRPCYNRCGGWNRCGCNIGCGGGCGVGCGSFGAVQRTDVEQVVDVEAVTGGNEIVGAPLADGIVTGPIAVDTVLNNEL